MRESTLALCLALLVLGPVESVAAQEQPAAERAAEPPGVVIRPGDLLRIRVWPDPDGSLAGEYLVEESGLVYLPLLGELRAGQRSLDEVRKAVREGYEQAIISPVVTVMPVFSVSVLGGVRVPGLYRIDPTQTLFDVVATAGGFTPDAKTRELRLIRDGRTFSVDATVAAATVTPLRSKDRIIVPESGQGFLSFRNVVTLMQLAISTITVVELTRR